MFSLEYITDEPTSFTSSPRQLPMDLSITDMGSCKRKRGFEADETSLKSISSPCSASASLSTPALSYSESFYDINDTLRPQPYPLQRNTSSDSRCSKRLHLTPKQRLSRHISTRSSDIASISSTTSPTSIVQACHICSRRPSTLQDLPAYNDCELCNKRTCFVCMRTCEGPKCQSMAQAALGFSTDLYTSGKKVCSRCCLEVGSEGTVWCNICYSDDTDLEISHKGDKEQLQAESEGRVAEWLNRFDGTDDMDLSMETATVLHEQFLEF